MGRVVGIGPSELHFLCAINLIQKLVPKSSSNTYGFSNSNPTNKSSVNIIKSMNKDSPAINDDLIPILAKEISMLIPRMNFKQSRILIFAIAGIYRDSLQSLDLLSTSSTSHVAGELDDNVTLSGDIKELMIQACTSLTVKQSEIFLIGLQSSRITAVDDVNVSAKLDSAVTSQSQGNRSFIKRTSATNLRATRIKGDTASSPVNVNESSSPINNGADIVNDLLNSLIGFLKSIGHLSPESQKQAKVLFQPLTMFSQAATDSSSLNIRCDSDTPTGTEVTIPDQSSRSVSVAAISSQQQWTLPLLQTTVANIVNSLINVHVAADTVADIANSGSDSRWETELRWLVQEVGEISAVTVFIENYTRILSVYSSACVFSTDTNNKLSHDVTGNKRTQSALISYLMICRTFLPSTILSSFLVSAASQLLSLSSLSDACSHVAKVLRSSSHEPLNNQDIDNTDICVDMFNSVSKSLLYEVALYFFIISGKSCDNSFSAVWKFDLGALKLLSRYHTSWILTKLGEFPVAALSSILEDISPALAKAIDCDSVITGDKDNDTTKKTYQEIEIELENNLVNYCKYIKVFIDSIRKHIKHARKATLTSLIQYFIQAMRYISIFVSHYSRKDSPEVQADGLTRVFFNRFYCVQSFLMSNYDLNVSLNTDNVRGPLNFEKNQMDTCINSTWLEILKFSSDNGCFEEIVEVCCMDLNVNRVVNELEYVNSDFFASLLAFITNQVLPQLPVNSENRLQVIFY